MTEYAALPWKVGFDDGSGPTYITDGNNDVVVSGCDDGWGIPQGVRGKANARLIVTACNNYEKLADAVDELLKVANLRGNNQLPVPEDDSLLWNARMQTAWDELEAIRNAEKQA